MEPLKPIKEKEVVNETSTKSLEILQNLENPKSLEILQKINGELCFSLQFGEKTLLISESKCTQLIPEFKKMNAEQKETFLLQAAIFGANPFTMPPEIYPVPFTTNGVTTYAPTISSKKYVEKGMENPLFDGMTSGVVIEKADGTFDFRKGQIYGKTELLKGGWCEIYIKGLREPIFRSVNLEEFEQRKSDGTLTKFWGKGGKPALMIEKVAQKQAMEIAMKMPKTYIAEELPVIEDVEHSDVSNQKAIASNEELFK